MNESSEFARLRVLRGLVVVLMVVMIIGVVVTMTAVTVGVLKLGSRATFPDGINIPEGTTVTAVTRGDDWIAVVTDQDRILIFDQTGQELRQEIDVRP